MNSSILDQDYSDIDTSHENFINTIWIIKDWPYIIQLITIVLPVVVFGIFGNVVVIFIIWKNPPIRTPTNLVILNMATADLLSLLLNPWITLVYDIFQNYPIGFIGCICDAAAECAILIASVISISAITYDRLTAIVLPKETRLTHNGAKILIAVSWIAGILLSIPLSLNRTYHERQWKDFLEIFCTEKAVIVNIYYYVIITVLIWLPLSIQLICYISIFIKLSQYEKVIIKSLASHKIGYKKRAAKMMFIVTLVFMICRLPYTALIIYRHYLIKKNQIGPSNEVQNQVNGTYHTLWFTSKYLIFVNSTLNPIIYGMTNDKFRRAFKTTRLSKWLFSTVGGKKKPIIIHQNKLIDNNLEPFKTNESLNQTAKSKSIFLIFTRKPKQEPLSLTPVTNRTRL